MTACRHCGKVESEPTMAGDNSCPWCGGWGCDRCEGGPEDDEWCAHDEACHKGRGNVDTGPIRARKDAP